MVIAEPAGEGFDVVFNIHLLLHSQTVGHVIGQSLEDEAVIAIAFGENFAADGSALDGR